MGMQETSTSYIWGVRQCLERVETTLAPLQMCRCAALQKAPLTPARPETVPALVQTALDDLPALDSLSSQVDMK